MSITVAATTACSHKMEAPNTRCPFSLSLLALPTHLYERRANRHSPDLLFGGSRVIQRCDAHDRNPGSRGHFVHQVSVEDYDNIARHFAGWDNLGTFLPYTELARGWGSIFGLTIGTKCVDTVGVGHSGPGKNKQKYC